MIRHGQKNEFGEIPKFENFPKNWTSARNNVPIRMLQKLDVTPAQAEHDATKMAFDRCLEVLGIANPVCWHESEPVKCVLTCSFTHTSESFSPEHRVEESSHQFCNFGDASDITSLFVRTTACACLLDYCKVFDVAQCLLWYVPTHLDLIFAFWDRCSSFDLIREFGFIFLSDDAFSWFVWKYFDDSVGLNCFVTPFPHRLLAGIASTV
jgi:hypothetical protein